MQNIVNKQRNIHDKLYLSMENLLIYFPKIINLNEKYRNNILDKIRIMNKDIKMILNKSNEILIDLKNKQCIKDDKLIHDLNDEEKEYNDIKEILPILMLYQLAKDFT